MRKTIQKAIMSAAAFLLASLVVLAQGPQTVSGTVTDPSGVAVVGASVFVKGTQNGAVTDLDGKYQLTRVNTSDVLVFSCIGYASKEVTWTGGDLHVVLEEDATLLV